MGVVPSVNDSVVDSTKHNAVSKAERSREKDTVTSHPGIVTVDLCHTCTVPGRVLGRIYPRRSAALQFWASELEPAKVRGLRD